MKYGIRTIDDIQVENKIVLCRVDMNSPLKKDRSGFSDTTRIKRCAPTIKELAQKGARLVVMTHQGSDVEYHNYYHTRLHARELAKLTGREVRQIDDVCGPTARGEITGLEPGEILLLDNVRFMAEEMTLFETSLKLSPAEQAETQVIKKLAPLADYYVCDAFAAAHRSQPTLVGFARVLPSAMGRLFEKEYTVLSSIINNPGRPAVFVLGGAKIQDAFLMMAAVLKEGIADYVLAGGLAGNLMLAASGRELGKKSVELLKEKNLWGYIGIAEEIIERYGEKVILPEDLAFVTDKRRFEVRVEELPDDDALLVDIGRQTAGRMKEVINSAGTIFFNGPPGVFEEELSEYGTEEILKAIADAGGLSVIGGGDSITAANKYGLTEKFSYVCTGGGALIRFLSGEELPVIRALKNSPG